MKREDFAAEKQMLDEKGDMDVSPLSFGLAFAHEDGLLLYCIWAGG